MNKTYTSVTLQDKVSSTPVIAVATTYNDGGNKGLYNRFLDFNSIVTGQTTPPDYPPLVSLTASGSGLVAGENLKITIGGAGSAMGGVCRLYYKSLVLPAEKYHALAGALRAGYVKKVHFVASDVSTVNNTTAVLPYQVTGGLTQIQKYGALGINNVDAQLRSCNIDINDEQYFNKDMFLDLELWNQVRECMVGYGTSNEIGSLLNYHDWKNFIIRNGSTSVAYDKFMGNPDTRAGSLGDMNDIKRVRQNAEDALGI
ncbi:hypothetical protein CAOG_05703 [Capsaspora owczarzaki ATCC 30864]|uniref:Uncharacterized protein n=1 Tax=Capsaspora owczarzaki (strain ATCC 30864) TaxID=595528 RepID=A0A0D2WSM4_CAPO3|nr:hypothetical protein CAOG_05703 [Capsaspora owczarzaki ATCC 30864]KJE95225.1 hypothetical protein CAOG_005703 [Capsaspora owczarzaki ATCC 30864]|eukprot:XP_004346376.1 hypothetical protein CAOG_05703 [Capsaspora owczarzaki ATCC 30864]